MNPQTRQTCPLCGEMVDHLIYRFHRAEEDAVLRKIRESNPGWSEVQGACSRCLDYYHLQILSEKKLIPAIGPHFPLRSADDFAVIPTPLRLEANPAYTGKGTTICMIDSGFYPHPDFTQPSNRILYMADISEPTRKPSYFRQPRDSSWHGTMTSAACAGNGYLSGGLYKAIASEAGLVLLKVEDEQGAITTENIAKAIHWAIEHRERYRIRIINLSLGDDWPVSYKDSPVDQAAEEAVKAGMVVVAAAGNDPNEPIKPPANSPSVIAVGGVNDHNTLGFMELSAYHSSYGATADGISKPELIAPAIWVAAPILPGTAEQREAETLYRLLKINDSRLKEALGGVIGWTRLDPALLQESSGETIRRRIRERIGQAKYLSPHYTHVDGTSFAAPITASIVAQMLEANPALQPGDVRELLFTTARRLPHLEAERQGYGVVNAGAAVEQAQKERHRFPVNGQASPRIDRRRGKIVFYYHDHRAASVALSGDFTGWSLNGFIFRKEKNGGWRCEIPLLPRGRYAYKFVVDRQSWISDPRNPHRQPDGFEGFNSIMEIE